MKSIKIISAVLLSLIVSAFAAVPAMAATADVAVKVGGVPIESDVSPKTIDGVAYVPLRAFCDAFGADAVSWDQKTQTATVSCRGIKITASANDAYIVANGRYLYLAQNRNISSRIFVPLETIAKAFGATVKSVSGGYNVVDSGSVIRSGAKFYDEDCVFWLARIIQAEAGGERLLGKIAVGNVVLNRVASKEFPNTIYGVIFDRKYGVQFTPVSSGTIYNAPSEASRIAAKICLEGYTVSDRILYFMNPAIATSTWISRARKYAMTIGNHAFYY
ncbi:MAG: cell wall hydrolase [Clostridia bacterium]|nr:cell wall hydrolase [Clostridia bacterium]